MAVKLSEGYRIKPGQTSPDIELNISSALFVGARPSGILPILPDSLAPAIGEILAKLRSVNVTTDSTIYSSPLLINSSVEGAPRSTRTQTLGTVSNASVGKMMEVPGCFRVENLAEVQHGVRVKFTNIMANKDLIIGSNSAVLDVDANGRSTQVLLHPHMRMTGQPRSGVVPVTFEKDGEFVRVAVVSPRFDAISDIGNLQYFKPDGASTPRNKEELVLKGDSVVVSGLNLPKNFPPNNPFCSVSVPPKGRSGEFNIAPPIKTSGLQTLLISL